MTTSGGASPRLPTWLAALAVSQLGLALLLYWLTTFFNGRASGGIVSVGHLVGAQALGSVLEMKFPGQGRPLRKWLSLWNTVLQVALGLVYFLVFGLPESPMTPDPQKTALVLSFALPIASILSFGITWSGLTLGIRAMEKQREKLKK